MRTARSVGRRGECPVTVGRAVMFGLGCQGSRAGCASAAGAVRTEAGQLSCSDTTDPSPAVVVVPQAVRTPAGLVGRTDDHPFCPPATGPQGDFEPYGAPTWRPSCAGSPRTTPPSAATAAGPSSPLVPYDSRERAAAAYVAADAGFAFDAGAEHATIDNPMAEGLLLLRPCGTGGHGPAGLFPYDNAGRHAGYHDGAEVPLAVGLGRPPRAAPLPAAAPPTARTSPLRRALCRWKQPDRTRARSNQGRGASSGQ